MRDDRIALRVLQFRCDGLLFRVHQQQQAFFPAIRRAKRGEQRGQVFQNFDRAERCAVRRENRREAAHIEAAAPDFHAQRRLAGAVDIEDGLPETRNIVGHVHPFAVALFLLVAPQAREAAAVRQMKMELEFPAVHDRRVSGHVRLQIAAQLLAGGLRLRVALIVDVAAVRERVGVQHRGQAAEERGLFERFPRRHLNRGLNVVLLLREKVGVQRALKFGEFRLHDKIADDAQHDD